MGRLCMRGGEGKQEISVPSIQYCCELKTVLKNQVFKKNFLKLTIRPHIVRP